VRCQRRAARDPLPSPRDRSLLRVSASRDCPRCSRTVCVGAFCTRSSRCSGALTGHSALGDERGAAAVVRAITLDPARAWQAAVLALPKCASQPALRGQASTSGRLGCVITRSSSGQRRAPKRVCDRRGSPMRCSSPAFVNRLNFAGLKHRHARPHGTRVSPQRPAARREVQRSVPLFLVQASGTAVREVLEVVRLDLVRRRLEEVPRAAVDEAALHGLHLRLGAVG
jgi:hypothetical protein